MEEYRSALEWWALYLLKSPLLTLIVYGIAIASAYLLLRYNSAAREVVRQAEASARFQAIDGLRGYLALGVFASHITVTWVYYTQGKWTFPDSNFYTLLGETCVTLFFMITAFLFWTKLLDSQVDARSIKLQNFILSRIWRIYPLYFVVLGVLTLLSYALQDWRSHESLSTTFIQCLRWLTFSMVDINALPKTAVLIAFVAWSLRYEWLFYGAYFLVLVVFAKIKSDMVALIVGASVMALFVLFDPGQRILPRYCFSFLGGILAAYCVRQPHFVGFLRHSIVGVVAVLLLMYVLFFQPNALTFVSLLLLTIFFVVVASGNMLGGVLRPAAVLWLGEISYGVYLLHGLLLWFGGQYLFRYCNTTIPSTYPQSLIFLALMPLVSVSVVLVSSATYFAVEKPGIVFGKQIIRQLNRSRTNSDG